MNALVDRRWLFRLILVALGAAPEALGQEETAAERFRELTEPKVAKKVEDEKNAPPFQLVRTQVAPFDSLPYVKPNHWITVSNDLRANHFAYQGRLVTEPIRLPGMSREVSFRRDASLLKGETTALPMQLFLPTVPNPLGLELTRPESIRADDAWPIPLRKLEPHQMLILVLARNPSTYNLWNRLRAFSPPPDDRDPLTTEERHYYRLVLPRDPKRPPLSPQPLTWTTISHVVWDGFPPTDLSQARQRALLDWLHWGGQMVINGGATPGIAALGESFLGPYLPAEASGVNSTLTPADLQDLTDAYRTPIEPEMEPATVELDEVSPSNNPDPDRAQFAHLRPAPGRPIFLAGLLARPEASRLSLGNRPDRLLGVEWRVGRGRILMVGVNLTDPAFMSWPGFDSLVRRVVLRRPEGPARTDPNRTRPKLDGPELTWVRYLGRDLGSRADPEPEPESARAVVTTVGDEPRPTPMPVAAWLDSAFMPTQARTELAKVSGITIPESSFVLRIILAYVVSLVPLNWLLCRFVLRRREWAWALVPVLALGFAITVERAAAYDLGYESACDEVDLLEIQGGYPRAHLSRFASIYSNSRVGYTISFPDDPTALALPMSAGGEVRGEDVSRSAWQSTPIPALIDLQVSPRSVSLFRAEQMIPLRGTLGLSADGASVVNRTLLELRDAVLINEDGRQFSLGTIGPGRSVVRPSNPSSSRGPDPTVNGIPLGVFLTELRDYRWGRPEDRGEIRLVAWSPGPRLGRWLEPGVDRDRALTLVVAHLRYGPPPAPDGLVYQSVSGAP